MNPKDTAAKFVQAFNAHDEAALRAIHAPNIRFEAPGEVRLQGVDAVTGYAMNWLKGFPDAKIVVSHEIVEGPWLVQEFALRGTHTAPLTTPMGVVGATGKAIDSRAVSVQRIEDGLIVQARLYFDQAAVMTQLGLMPEPVATA